MQTVAKEEASKMIVKTTVKTVVEETFQGLSGFSFKNTANVILNNSVETIALKSTQELAKQGIKEGTKKLAIEASKETVFGLSVKGFAPTLEYGSKETVKTVTEKSVVQQGGKAWLVNLGKAVPIIGAGISGIMNTFSTAKIGIKLINKLDEEFDNNRQRKVDIIKGKVYGLYNIIDQLKIMLNYC